MKHLLLIILFPVSSLFSIVRAQEMPLTNEQQLEALANIEQSASEDDGFLLQLEQFRKNPVNLNTADESDLKELRVLTGLQIASFLAYRKLLGQLIDIYELQAVPAWDIYIISQLRPFITLASALSVRDDLRSRLRNGDHSVLLRVSREWQQSNSRTAYAGSPGKIFLRYRYSFRNLLQFGIAGDKDAGEQFFKGVQKAGFDFYSVHGFVRNLRWMKALALGDFTVNMGQGLVQWQGLAFRKSGDVLAIKRQSPVLRPYSSAGEINFHRGVGITIKSKNIESTFFMSIRRINASLQKDSIGNASSISSFLTSGYNRTHSEIAGRHRVSRISAGGNIVYHADRWQVGLNAVAFQFSLPLAKDDRPYNLFAIRGRRWYNMSADYSYTYRNFHVFGEAAIDKNLHTAFISGLLVSVDHHVDLSFLYRHIDKAYQSIGGNAFTENSTPTNEYGFYAGITLRPAASWRLDAYADIYQFPWLKYLVDAPGHGKDFLLQVTYRPTKQVEIYMRYKNENKAGNYADDNYYANDYPVGLTRQNFRLQINCKISSAIQYRSRIELSWYKPQEENSENGFLGFFDLVVNPLQKPYSGTCRIQYFETGSYDSRIYAYENDVLYSFSIPAFFDKGYRYYFIANYKIGEKISLWLRWGQTFRPIANTGGSMAETTSGYGDAEVKLQVRCIF